MIGVIVLDNSKYKVKTSNGILEHEIGYVKYGNKIDTQVDIGFIDYYPITQFLLEKLFSERTTCIVETKNEQISLHENKLIIII